MSSLQPVPAPRTPRGRLVAKEFVSSAAAATDLKMTTTTTTTKMPPMPNDSERRKPFVWTKDEFNLTELIDSVEKNILKLEEMENRTVAAAGTEQDGPGGLLTLPLTDEILNLPGYKPKTTRQKSGKVTAFHETSREREIKTCLLYTSPSPRDRQKSRMPSSA